MAYVKYKGAWSSGDPRSAQAFNHIETQCTDLKTIYDAHNHDSTYYAKALADSTFFSTSSMGSGSGFDADMIDGLHFADLVNNVLPIGTIMMWSGTDGDIPTAWHICDGGTYGGYITPDLRDRFVIGAGGSYAVNATGGPATYDGTITPTGTVTVGAHALTTAELPPHTHGYTEYYAPINCAAWDVAAQILKGLSSVERAIGEQAIGNVPHGHPGSSAVFTAIDSRPAYYALYYIMKYA